MLLLFLDEKPLPLGMPNYMASGGHHFGETRYRFLILPRYDFDLHSIIRSRQMETKNILIIANQLIDILEHIHDCGYAHSDIKAENIMIGKCQIKKKINSNDSNKKMATNRGGGGNDGHGKSVRRLRLTMQQQQQNGGGGGGRTTSKSKQKYKSYAESSTSESNNKSDDSDFGEDFEKLSSDDTDENQSLVDSDNFSSDNDKYSDKDFKPFSRRRAAEIEFGGSNPVRSCRMETQKTQIYDDMVRSHYLRRSTKKVNYCENEADEEQPKPRIHDADDDDEWGRKNRYLKRYHPASLEKFARQSKCDGNQLFNELKSNAMDEYEYEDRIHLIDFGLALKFIDSNGVHRPFVMDQRRAHDGTLEFTSRDAHMGAHSRRSDLECLAYNLIYWKEGYLPWKNEKIMSQPEQVHRLKEYFMTDIKQLYKKIYNVPIPTFIYEFLMHVSNLAYHDRPNYKLCREIFLKEFRKLGYKSNQMKLNVTELKAAPLRNPDADEIDSQNILSQKLTDVAKMMKMGMLMPFCETPSTPNQISPKNLRSKATRTKRRTKFSWTEILSTDPDQIARQRAEKEFEREQCDQTPVRRYSGNPTYAIIQTENLKSKGKFDMNDNSDDYIKGYTKPMMDIWRKRQSLLIKQFQQIDNDAIEEEKTPTNPRTKRRQRIITEKSVSGSSAEDVRLPPDDEAIEKKSTVQITPEKPTKTTRRRKSGLRHVLTPTKKISDYRQTKATNRRRKTVQPTTKNSQETVEPATATDNNFNGAIPCCDMSTKLDWWDINASNGTGTKNSSSSSSTIGSSEASQSSNTTTASQSTKGRRKYNSSCGMSSPASEEDSHDPFDYRRPTRYIRTRGAHTTSKPLVISDEDSRDTTDYSPVKNRHKRTKDGKINRRNKRIAARGGKFF